jgi:hypothetical protein
MPRLENWSVVSLDNPFKAPELRTSKLEGNIYDDSRFADGTPVTTSTICEMDASKNYAKTRNTEYQLGKVSEDFLIWINSNGYKLEEYVKR